MRIYWIGVVLALSIGTTSYAADAPASPAPIAVAAPGCPAEGCTTPGCTSGKCKHGRSNCGLCGLKQYPILEKRYIQQFCQPSIAPGSCFGYFQTQWTPWAVGCPNWHTGTLPPASLNWGPPARNEIPEPANPGPERIPPARPEVPGTGATPLKEAPVTPKDLVPIPKVDAPKPPTVPPMAPKSSVLEKPSKLNERGLILPPVPEIPTSTPARY